MQWIYLWRRKKSLGGKTIISLRHKYFDAYLRVKKLPTKYSFDAGISIKYQFIQVLKVNDSYLKLENILIMMQTKWNAA